MLSTQLRPAMRASNCPRGQAPIRCIPTPNIAGRGNPLRAGGLHTSRRVSEFIVVSLLAKRFNLPIVPHVGDMGQLHQHLVLFNHIALGMSPSFLNTFLISRSILCFQQKYTMASTRFLRIPVLPAILRLSKIGASKWRSHLSPAWL
jgi:hypothetical protein